MSTITILPSTEPNMHLRASSRHTAVEREQPVSIRLRPCMLLLESKARVQTEVPNCKIAIRLLFFRFRGVKSEKGEEGVRVQLKEEEPRGQWQSREELQPIKAKEEVALSLVAFSCCEMKDEDEDESTDVNSETETLDEPQYHFLLQFCTITEELLLELSTHAIF